MQNKLKINHVSQTILLKNCGTRSAAKQPVSLSVYMRVVSLISRCWAQTLSGFCSLPQRRWRTRWRRSRSRSSTETSEWPSWRRRSAGRTSGRPRYTAAASWGWRRWDWEDTPPDHEPPSALREDQPITEHKWVTGGGASLSYMSVKLNLMGESVC